MKRRIRFPAIVFSGLLFCGLMSAPAEACPMCRTATESEKTDARPRAYMYSILFMLAVPATLVTGFSIGFYRLSKQQQAANAGDDAESP